MERVTRRSHAYFPPELLASQLAAFERPDAREPDCLLVDGERDLDAVAEEVMARLGVDRLRRGVKAGLGRLKTGPCVGAGETQEIGAVRNQK